MVERLNASPTSKKARTAPPLQAANILIGIPVSMTIIKIINVLITEEIHVAQISLHIFFIIAPGTNETLSQLYENILVPLAGKPIGIRQTFLLRVLFLEWTSNVGSEIKPTSPSLRSVRQERLPPPDPA
ncbi:hypothetical protein [Mesorhizobium sp. M1329]|uniref:hypothetical protein n=1 Tax=Mesorhizobium sp. M1329 TaxID=2957083 RepID=UPI00333A47ED